MGEQTYAYLSKVNGNYMLIGVPNSSAATLLEKQYIIKEINEDRDIDRLLSKFNVTRLYTHVEMDMSTVDKLIEIRDEGRIKVVLGAVTIGTRRQVIQVCAGYKAYTISTRDTNFDEINTYIRVKEDNTVIINNQTAMSNVILDTIAYKKRNNIRNYKDMTLAVDAVADERELIMNNSIHLENYAELVYADKDVIEIRKNRKGYVAELNIDDFYIQYRDAYKVWNIAKRIKGEGIDACIAEVNKGSISKGTIKVWYQSTDSKSIEIGKRIFDIVMEELS